MVCAFETSVPCLPSTPRDRLLPARPQVLSPKHSHQPEIKCSNVQAVEDILTETTRLGFCLSVHVTRLAGLQAHHAGWTQTEAFVFCRSIPYPPISPLTYTFPLILLSIVLRWNFAQGVVSGHMMPLYLMPQRAHVWLVLFPQRRWRVRNGTCLQSFLQPPSRQSPSQRSSPQDLSLLSL